MVGLVNYISEGGDNVSRCLATVKALGCVSVGPTFSI